MHGRYSGDVGENGAAETGEEGTEPPDEPASTNAAPPAGVDKRARALAQRHVIYGQLLQNALSYIVVGGMMMLFAHDVLHFSAKTIASILAAFPFVAILALPLLGVIRRFGKARTVVAGDLVRLGVVLSLLFLPVHHLSFTVYLALLMAYQAAFYLTVGVVWQPLLRDITTVDDRGRFFARMRFSFTTVTVLITAGIPFFIGDEITAAQYRVLLAIPVIGLLNHMFWISKVPEIRVETPARPAGRWRDNRIWRVLRTSRALRLPLLVNMLLQLPGFPLYVVYLRQVMHMPSYIISVFLFCPVLGAALSLLVWGRVADAIGFRRLLSRLLIAAMAIVPLHLLILPLAGGTPGWQALGSRGALSITVLFLMGFLGGVINSGRGLATTIMLHYHVKREDAIEAMNVFRIATLATGLALSLFAGFWLQDIVVPAGDHYLWNQALHFDWVKGYFLFLGIPIRCAVLILVRKLTEARSG